MDDWCCDIYWCCDKCIVRISMNSVFGHVIHDVVGGKCSTARQLEDASDHPKLHSKLKAVVEFVEGKVSIYV